MPVLLTPDLRLPQRFTQTHYVLYLIFCYGAIETLNWTLIDRLIDLALDEDIGPGDITSEITVPAELEGQGTLIAKSPGILAGVPVAQRVLTRIDERLSLKAWKRDGDILEAGNRIGSITGPVRAMLTAERTLLNFLQRLSGVATLTAQYVEAVKDTQARIVDTRKTTPGLRMLQKYAVRVGGGHNHRFGLYDAVLIKDNHIAAAGGVIPAVRAARASIPHTMRIEVEVKTAAQVEEAIEAKPDIIMLDNMSPEQMRQAVERIGGQTIVEASGNISLETVSQVAATGVDIISVGALTHSALSLDISLEIEAE